MNEAAERVSRPPARALPAAVEIIEPPPPVRATPVLEVMDDEPPARAVMLARRAVLPRVSTVRPSLFVTVVRGIDVGVTGVLGVATLVGGLAVMAPIPVLQLLSFGYLLEAGGRVARTGRLRDGFIGVRLTARLGGVVVACWLFVLPVRFVSELATSAEIIDPGGQTAGAWRLGWIVLAGLTAVHLATAVTRGGQLRYFLWPFNAVSVALRIGRGGFYAEARDAIWDTLTALRLPHYFWLGLRGVAASFVWLAVPVGLLVLARLSPPGAGLVGLIGAFLLAAVLMYLPFLQTRMAAENRFGAAFEWLAVRREYGRAPWAFAAGFVVALVFALPLYFLKIEVVPRDAAWLPGILLVALHLPARLLIGWALGRAKRRVTRRHWFFRWTGRLPFLPAALVYVGFVFLTQYVSWNGVWSFFDVSAFGFGV